MRVAAAPTSCATRLSVLSRALTALSATSKTRMRNKEGNDTEWHVVCIANLLG